MIWSWKFFEGNLNVNFSLIFFIVASLEITMKTILVCSINFRIVLSRKAPIFTFLLFFNFNLCFVPRTFKGLGFHPNLSS